MKHSIQLARRTSSRCPCVGFVNLEDIHWAVGNQDAGETPPPSGDSASTAGGQRNKVQLSMITGLLGNFVQYKKTYNWNIWPKQSVFLVSSFVGLLVSTTTKYCCQSITLSIRDH